MFASVLGPCIVAVVLGVGDGSDRVVSARLEWNGIGDGLESYVVRLKIAGGCHLVPGPAAGKAPGADAVSVEFFVDGGRTACISAGDWLPPGRPDRLTGAVNFTAELDYDDTRHAKVVAARIRVTAYRDGRKLPPAVVTAEFASDRPPPPGFRAPHNPLPRRAPPG